MKIYSWNVYYRNPDFDAVVRFIENLDFDVICLQEVPEVLLERLRELPFHLAHGVDVTRFVPGGKHHIHLAILSKHPILASREFDLPIPHLPWRTRVLIRALHAIDWRFHESHGGLWADVEIGGKRIRIFDLHISLAYPHSRKAELDRAIKEIDPGVQNILAGDFNIIEAYRVSGLNWVLGGALTDVLFKHRERTNLERYFASKGFKNPLRGIITHDFSRSQLDHILVPRDAVVVHQAALAETCGSDHKPVFVELHADR